MRKKIVAGNWKMNLGFNEARSLAAEVCTLIVNDPKEMDNESPQVIFFPPSLYITQTVAITGSIPGIYTGAQNCHQETKGAFTGEISASMLSSCGATHTLVGHSERRSLFMEDDALLAAKTQSAINNDIIPVFCCGEHLPQRESGEHFETVKQQLYNGLFFLDKESFQKVIVAYEPVWAIGTGVTATAEQAQEMHAFIRGLIREKYDEQTANNTSILYGGSCNAKNASELFSNPDVDGGLIGGASLKADDFFAIIKSF